MTRPRSASFLPIEPTSWRVFHLLALLCAVPLLLLWVAVMELRFSSLSLQSEVKEFLARVEKRAAEERRRRRVEFILVDPPPTPEKEEVKDATVMAAVQRQARDRSEEPSAKEEPKSTGEGVLKVAKAGKPEPPQRAGQPKRPTPPRPATPAPQSPPVPHPTAKPKPAAAPEMPESTLPSLKKVIERENRKALAKSPSVTDSTTTLAPRVKPSPKPKPTAEQATPKKPKPIAAVPERPTAPPLV
ncbi:MAG: hypothetical protein ACYTGH_03545, partial [Planctomycetota bacterium]